MTLVPGFVGAGHIWIVSGLDLADRMPTENLYYMPYHTHTHTPTKCNFLNSIMFSIGLGSSQRSCAMLYIMYRDRPHPDSKLYKQSPVLSQTKPGESKIMVGKICDVIKQNESEVRQIQF